MQQLKKITLIFGIILLLLGALGSLFAYFYEDEVKKIILTEINKQVAVPINVGDISFSIFKKFPYASLEFKKVEMRPKNDATQLANINSIFLQFNIIDILNKNYIIKKIAIENGAITLLIDKKGNTNFHIFKETTNSSEQNNVLALKEVVFKNITVYYANAFKNIDGAVAIQKLSFSGNFSADAFSMKVNAALFFEQMNSNNTLILKNKNVAFSTEFDVNTTANLFSIKKGNLSIEDLDFNLSGKLTSIENGLSLNLLSKGNDLEFKALFSLLPTHQKSFLDGYNATGTINYNTTIKGELTSTHVPTITADFEIKNAQLEEKKSGYQLNNISLKGSFTNGKKAALSTSKLDLSNVSATFGAGHISGNYIVSNFENPYIELQTQANVEIEMAKQFFKLDSLEIASGNVILNLAYNGYISNIQEIKASELQQLNAKGNALLENVQLKFKNNNFSLINANGYFRFNDNAINIDSLTTTLNHSPVFIQGKFTNLLAYIFTENEGLEVSATFKSPKFILDDFITKDESKKNDEAYELVLPKRVIFNLATKIDTFVFRKFLATNFKGDIALEDNVLTATDVSFKTMEGSINGNIALDYENPTQLLITSSAFLANINVTQLFYQFENFGQTEIDAKNLKGNANISFSFASVLDNQLNFQKDKIYVSSEVTISNGELLNYEPIMALSKFIAVEDLKHIKFNTLNTQIEIINQKITLSKTAISSSAIGLTVAGTHTFDNEIDYRFKVMLNEILWKKAKTKNKNEEFGYVEDDGLGKTALFLKMTGTTENYKIAYDTDGLKSTFKESIKEEKKTIKSILNKEFGWFKKDSLSAEKEKPKNGFKIKWEEENDKNKDEKSEQIKKEKNTKPTNEKEKKGLRKFLDKIAQPNEDEVEQKEDF